MPIPLLLTLQLMIILFSLSRILFHQPIYPKKIVTSNIDSFIKLSSRFNHLSSILLAKYLETHESHRSSILNFFIYPLPPIYPALQTTNFHQTSHQLSSNLDPPTPHLWYGQPFNSRSSILLPSSLDLSRLSNQPSRPPTSIQPLSNFCQDSTLRDPIPQRIDPSFEGFKRSSKKMYPLPLKDRYLPNTDPSRDLKKYVFTPSQLLLES